MEVGCVCFNIMGYKNKNPDIENIGEHIEPLYVAYFFSHPDCTVGFGITPNQLLRD